MINNITEGRSKRQIKKLKTYIDHIREKLNVTCLIITNTTKLAQNVDRIIYMKQGQVVEDGTHMQLMANKK